MIAMKGSIAMNKIRIFKGEFEGQIIVQNHVVDFWAIRNELGLSASFDRREATDITEKDCFKVLEDIVYGNS